MKTRERILVTSLALLNNEGEPNITTIDIANEMDISPGNLYYHFRNKDDIIFELYLLYEASILEVLNTPASLSAEDSQPNVMEFWSYLHLIFERIWEYRFLYRDLPSILERNSTLKVRFNRLLDKKGKASLNILTLLSDIGAIDNAHKSTLKSIATHIVFTTTYWFSFQEVRQAHDTEITLDQGVYQVLMLVSPYLPKEQRDEIQAIANRST